MNSQTLSERGARRSRRATGQAVRRLSAIGAWALALCVLGRTGVAAVYTYTGPATSAVWNSTANWGGAGVPGAGDTATIGYDVTFTDFNGQSVGVINAIGSGVTLIFNGAGTLTLNNNGSAATITSDQLTLRGGADFVFTNNLLLDVNTTYSSNELNTGGTGGGTIRGSGTLSIDAGDFGWKSSDGTVIDVPRLDLTGSARWRVAANELPNLSGVEVVLGSTPSFLRVDFANNGSFAGLTGAHLEMPSSYQLFNTVTHVPTGGENIELASWTVGSTILPAGTYDVNSATIGDANFSSIFAGAGGALMSFTVVPEPASLALLAVGGLLAWPRRRPV